jgi:uncharacterized damage-inducible protein DinB
MRTDADPTGPEQRLLEQFLDVQRATVLEKADGLDRAQLASGLPPSTLSLGGLLYHLALVEEGWTEVRFGGQAPREPWASVDRTSDPDWEWRAAGQLEPDGLRARYREACDRSRAVVAAASSLDQLSIQPKRDGQRFSLRWMLLHLIEETARHAGHADLLREAIDGSVGV